MLVLRLGAHAGPGPNSSHLATAADSGFVVVGAARSRAKNICGVKRFQGYRSVGLVETAKAGVGMEAHLAKKGDWLFE